MYGMELQSVGAPWVQDGGGAGSAESNANSDALAGVLSLTVRRRSHFVLFLLFFPIAYGYCVLWAWITECCCLLLPLFCHFCGYLKLCGLPTRQPRRIIRCSTRFCRISSADHFERGFTVKKRRLTHDLATKKDKIVCLRTT